MIHCQEKSYDTGKYFFKLIPQKACHMFKEQFIYCTRNCFELMWIGGNQLEDNTSQNSKISLHHLGKCIFNILHLS